MRTKANARKSSGGAPTRTRKTEKPAKVERRNKDGSLRKPHRYRPGTVALRDIRRYQQSTNLLLKKKPFMRLAKEVADDFMSNARFQAKAMELLQEAAEMFLTGVFEKSVLAQIHTTRVTLMPKDMRLVARILSMDNVPIYSEICDTSAQMKSTHQDDTTDAGILPANSTLHPVTHAESVTDPRKKKAPVVEEVQEKKVVNAKPVTASRKKKAPVVEDVQEKDFVIATLPVPKKPKASKAVPALMDDE